MPALAAMVVSVAMAALVILTVAGSVIPRQATIERTAFPWFWVAFPITCILVASAICSWFPWMPAEDWNGMGSGLYVSLPEDSGSPFGPDSFTLANQASFILPALALIGVGLSTWAWKKRRL